MIRTILCGRKQVTVRCIEFLSRSNEFVLQGILTDSQFADSPTVEAARRFGVPILDWSYVNQAAASDQLDVDLIVSMLYWRKFKGPLIELPKLGTINFHPAPLPHYKGTAGYNLAILESLSEWAVSAHYVDENIDTGPIIQTASFPIDVEEETVASLEAKSAKALYELFESVVTRVADTHSLD
jgi:methionyl-tRNA formyltransferase